MTSVCVVLIEPVRREAEVKPCSFRARQAQRMQNGRLPRKFRVQKCSRDSQHTLSDCEYQIGYLPPGFYNLSLVR